MLQLICRAARSEGMCSTINSRVCLCLSKRSKRTKSGSRRTRSKIIAPFDWLFVGGDKVCLSRTPTFFSFSFFPFSLSLFLFLSDQLTCVCDHENKKPLQLSLLRLKYFCSTRATQFAFFTLRLLLLQLQLQLQLQRQRLFLLLLLLFFNSLCFLSSLCRREFNCCRAARFVLSLNPTACDTISSLELQKLNKQLAPNSAFVALNPTLANDYIHLYCCLSLFLSLSLIRFLP